ncbi:TPA: hypothetical protein ACH3X2_011974 [Trebouxia sp. C0005]
MGAHKHITCDKTVQQCVTTSLPCNKHSSVDASDTPPTAYGKQHNGTHFCPFCFQHAHLGVRLRLCDCTSPATSRYVHQGLADTAGMSALSHGRNLKQAIECSDAQKQASVTACGLDPSYSSDGLHYFICLSGDAAGGCRSQEEGTFSSDCTSSCVI